MSSSDDEPINSDIAATSTAAAHVVAPNSTADTPSPTTDPNPVSNASTLSNPAAIVEELPEFGLD